MITDQQTNKVYISSLLKLKHQKLYERLTQLFDQCNILFDELEGTKDIWVRDFMPVQVEKDKFVQFNYNPSYLKGKVYDMVRTKQEEVGYPQQLKIADKIDIVLDGGNVVKGERKAIITSKVFKDNVSDAGQPLIDKKKLEEILGVDEVIIVPPEPGDFTGHADGLVRFQNDDTVLVSDHTEKQNKDGAENVQQIDSGKLYGSLTWAGLSVLQIPYFFSDMKCMDTETKSKIEDYTAIGNYNNYLQVGKLIFLPQYYRENDVLGADRDFVQEMDRKAFARFEAIFGIGNVIPVDCYDIALRGGVLNCITWNVLE